MRALVAFLLLCSVACGQVTVEVRQILSGVTGLETIGDKVFVSPDSKPVVESVGFVDLGKLPASPQSIKVIVTDAQRKPVSTDKISSSQWIIRGEGHVWIDARVIDLPSQFLLDESLELELPAKLPPKPDPGKPVDPLAGLQGESRKVMATFVQGMAADMDAMAVDIQSGKLKTVLDASAANNTRDIQTRSIFKQSMARLMEPKLGSGNLPQDAPKTFADIASGFRSVK